MNIVCVNLVDPFPFLRNIPDADIAFMDDGAKSPRFAPYFSNSGFYYVKYNERSRYLMEKMLKSICEIAFTHSHQATLIVISPPSPIHAVPVPIDIDPDPPHVVIPELNTNAPLTPFVPASGDRI